MTACSAKCILAIVIMSVCLSVLVSCLDTKPSPGEIETSPYDSVESLVSCEQILCRWVRRFLLNEDIKEGCLS